MSGHIAQLYSSCSKNPTAKPRDNWLMTPFEALEKIHAVLLVVYQNMIVPARDDDKGDGMDRTRQGC